MMYDLLISTFLVFLIIFLIFGSLSFALDLWFKWKASKRAEQYAREQLQRWEIQQQHLRAKLKESNQWEKSDENVG